MKTIGVIGTGQMGAGIMQVSALAGYETIGYDQRSEAGEQAIQTIERMLKIATRKEGLPQEKADAAKTRLRTTTNLSDLAACDLVIEAIVENIEVNARFLRS